MSIFFTKLAKESPNNSIWIWKIDQESDASIIDEMLLIYPDELSAIKNMNRKIQWGISRKIVFDNYAGKRIIQNENGYPFIEEENCFLSISHSKDYLAVKTSDKPCGIDIQEISERVLKIKDKFLSEKEKGKFEGNTENLIIAWTVKEAMYKMLNTLGIEFKSQLLIEEIDHVNNIVKARYNIAKENIENPLFTEVKLKFEKIENHIFTQTL